MVKAGQVVALEWIQSKQETDVCARNDTVKAGTSGRARMDMVAVGNKRLRSKRHSDQRSGSDWHSQRGDECLHLKRHSQCRDMSGRARIDTVVVKDVRSRSESKGHGRGKDERSDSNGHGRGGK